LVTKISKQIAKAHIKIQVPTQEVWIALTSKKWQILLQEAAVVRVGFLVVAQSQALAHQALEAENDKFKKNHPIKQRIHGENRLCMAYR